MCKYRKLHDQKPNLINMGGTYYIDVVGLPFNWIYLGGVYLDIGYVFELGFKCVFKVTLINVNFHTL